MRSLVSRANVSTRHFGIKTRDISTHIVTTHWQFGITHLKSRVPALNPPSGIVGGFKRSGHSFKEAKAERKAEVEFLRFQEAEAEAEAVRALSEAVDKAVSPLRFHFAGRMTAVIGQLC